jgi:hypothetical protein
MNERIHELAEQAVEDTQLLMIMEYKNFESKLYEKFAELIVRECAEHIDFAIFSNGGIDGRSLKDHFGVEE